MDFTRQVNYKSDFDVLLHVTDAEDNAVGFPDFDFILTFTTSGNTKFEGGQVDGTKRNVTDKDGDIHIAFDNHKLLPGLMRLDVTADVKDDTYPDGKKRYVFSVPTNITLTANEGEVSTGLVINVKLPFVYTAGSSSSSEGGGGSSSQS